jgi:hypothetical protein
MVPGPFWQSQMSQCWQLRESAMTLMILPVSSKVALSAQ